MSKDYAEKSANDKAKDTREVGHYQRNSKKSRSNSKSRGTNSSDTRKGVDKKSTSLGQSAPTPQHLVDVASYSFRNALGTRLELRDAETPNWQVQSISIPGIAALYFTPTYGYSADNTSGLNVAIKQAYAKVRAPKSGTAYFNAPDLFMVYGAVDSLYMYHSMMCRLYGLLNLYTTQNRYYPEGIFQALKVDFPDLLKNMALFRTYINQFALSISRFYLPLNIPIFNRHYAMCSGFFVDSPSEKAQAYIYTPTSLYMYDETSSSSGGFLKNINITTGDYAIHTYDDIVRVGNALLKSVIDSEEIARIMADVQYVYSDSEVLRPGLIDEFYITTPMYMEGILMDINNTIVTGDIKTGTADIVQNVDTLTVLYSPSVTQTGFSPLLTRKVINAQGDYTSPDYVMMMTRHMTGGKYVGEGAPDLAMPYHVALTSFGAEIINKIVVVGVNWDQLGKSTFVDVATITGNGIKSNSHDLSVFVLSQFDYHPVMYVYSDAGDTFTFQTLLGDIDNYTTVSNENLRMMHDVNLAYLLGIPTDNVNS